MAFEYSRKIRFHETDAAGVMYFANLMVLCHEAYEASLAAFGIDLREFFSSSGLSYPIVHASMDFSHPLYCGDLGVVTVVPVQQTDSSFTLSYRLFCGSDSIAKAVTRHVCINRHRRKTALPSQIIAWMAAL